MSTPNNPAGRLLAILQAGRQIDGKKSILDTWTELLGVPPGDTSTLLQMMGEVLKLPNEITALLTRTLPPEDIALFTSWRPQVEFVFSRFDLNNRWEDIRTRLTDDLILSLRHCDRHLHRLAPEPVVSRDNLADIQESVDQLFEEVAAADIEIDVKRTILEHLARVSAAIRQMRVHGVRAVREAVHAAVGELAVHQELLRRTERSKVGRKFVALLRGILLGLQVVNSTAELAENAAFLLETGTEPAETPVPEDGDFREGEVVDA